MLISFLRAQSAKGSSRSTLNVLMIANSKALRAAQEMISRRIFELLALALGGLPALIEIGQARASMARACTHKTRDDPLLRLKQTCACHSGISPLTLSGLWA